MISIHIPPHLKEFACSPSAYLAAHAEISNLIVGAFIFTKPSDSKLKLDNPRLLSIQRAATESGFPNLWEVPGGGTESSDPTIFHSVARETFEETGLKLTRIVRQIGNGVDFETGRGLTQKKWRKLNFEIEVEQSQTPRAPGENVHSTESTISKFESTIRLDPAEHQAHAWASMEELVENVYPITVPEQRQLMIHAFEAFSHCGLSAQAPEPAL